LSDKYVNALQVKYGYAITCHKSQGSEWDTVFLDCNLKRGFRNRETFQWFYTGVTRSSNQLYLVDMPRNLAMDGGIRLYTQSSMDKSIPTRIDAPIPNTVITNSNTPTQRPTNEFMGEGMIDSTIGKHKTTVVTEDELRRCVTCDWNSMSMAAKQIVQHVLSVAGDIPCTITDVTDHAYHVILTIQTEQQEGRLTVYYTGKHKISNFKKIDACIPNELFQRIKTIKGRDVMAQHKVVNPSIVHESNGIEPSSSCSFSTKQISVVETFIYPPEYEYFLKEYMQRLEKKMELTHIAITEMQNLQFRLRVTFTREHQSAVIDIQYRGKGLISRVGDHPSGCPDKAFKDEVLRYILGE